MNSEELIKEHEGFRNRLYEDSVGILTIGYGRNMTLPISQDVADLMFKEDHEKACVQASTFAWYGVMDEVRQAVVENMIFNLGHAGFSKFKKTIQYLENMNYQMAAMEMLESKWATQVGKRAKTLSYMMEDGEWP